MTRPGPSASTPVALSRRRAARPLDVALVAMPFASFERPSIQIGLLKAVLDRHGHRAEAMHLYVDFVRALIGCTEPAEDALTFYQTLAEQRFAQADWFFSGSAFGAEAPDPDLMLDEQARNREDEGLEVDWLMTVYRDLVPAFLDQVVEEIDWGRYDVVGFTSTFQQNAASFALATRLAEAHPDVTILFGGANFDSVMGEEWVRSMPFIDYAIQGEADEALPAFLDALSLGEDPLSVPGVIGRRDGEVVATPPAPVGDLDDSPVPDYADYFERIGDFGSPHRLGVVVPFESARGCWWGERRHCTFCGLNGQTMAFRSKSQRHVLNDLTTMALEHRVLRFNAVDNIIDMGYFERLLPELAARDRPFRLFYETKADLDRAQIELMIRAGVDDVQPGIESLSSRVLGLMRKGTRAIWNVNLLRWGRYYGMGIHWNLIWGFPGETADDIDEQIAQVPNLVHLPPPGGWGRVWMERFSPLFNETDRFPTSRLTPSSTYRYAYPERVDLAAAAYFFDYDLDDTLTDDDYAPLAAVVDDWMERAQRDDAPSLTVDDRGDHLLVDDRRRHDAPRTLELTGTAAGLHRACMDHWRPARELSTELELSPEELADAIAELRTDGLVFSDGNLHVALALPVEAPPIAGRSVPEGRSCRPKRTLTGAQ